MNEIVCDLHHQIRHETGFQVSRLIQIRASDDPVLHMDVMPRGEMGHKSPSKGASVNSPYFAVIVLTDIILNPFQFICQTDIVFCIRFIKPCISCCRDKEILAEFVNDTAKIPLPVTHCPGQKQNDRVLSVTEFMNSHSFLPPGDQDCHVLS